MDVLMAAGAHDPSPLRAFIEAPPHQGRLLGLLIQTLGQAGEGGLQEQAPPPPPPPPARGVLQHQSHYLHRFSNELIQSRHRDGGRPNPTTETSQQVKVQCILTMSAAFDHLVSLPFTSSFRSSNDLIRWPALSWVCGCQSGCENPYHAVVVLH